MGFPIMGDDCSMTSKMWLSECRSIAAQEPDNRWPASANEILAEARPLPRQLSLPFGDPASSR
jgi:hypothetical protein